MNGENIFIKFACVLFLFFFFLLCVIQVWQCVVEDRRRRRRMRVRDAHNATHVVDAVDDAVPVWRARADPRSIAVCFVSLSLSRN